MGEVKKTYGSKAPEQVHPLNNGPEEIEGIEGFDGDSEGGEPDIPDYEFITTETAISLINELIINIREAQLPNAILAIGKLEGAIARLLQQ